MKVGLSRRIVLGVLVPIVAGVLPIPDALAQGRVPGSAASSALPAAPRGAESFVVPQGGPAELLQFLESLRGQRPAAFDEQSLIRFRQKIGRAALEAAERILARRPTAEQAEEAAYAKLDALALLDRLGDAAARKKMIALPGELRSAGFTEIARDTEAYLLDRRLRQARTLEPKELTGLMKDVKKFLAAAPATQDDVELAMMAANMAEMAAGTSLAADAYRDFGQVLSASAEKSIAGTGAMMIGAARRLTLTGQKMRVEGKTVDGRAFDWAQYRGKVVLVDFWATWCGPCLAEIPNLQKSYEAYRNRGFEVVGISLDQDRQQLQAFLRQRQIAWPVLFDAARGTDSMATYYGVFAIPSMVLVDRQGKVVATEIHGPELDATLERLLGPGS